MLQGLGSSDHGSSAIFSVDESFKLTVRFFERDDRAFLKEGAKNHKMSHILLSPSYLTQLFYFSFCFNIYSVYCVVIHRRTSKEHLPGKL